MYPIPAHFRKDARVKNTGKKCTRAKRKQRRQSSFTTYPRSRIARAVNGDIVAFGECYSTLARVLCARNKTVCAYLSFSVSLRRTSVSDERFLLGIWLVWDLPSWLKKWVSVACRFETNKKLRLHAIILFAFARLNIYTHAVYIHTQYARAQT